MKKSLLIITFLFLGHFLFAQAAGNALDFDGTNDYVDAGTGMSSMTDYTIEANIYYKGGGSAWIMHFSDGTLNERLQLEVGGGQLVSYNQSAGVGTSVFAGGAIDANTWYHIAITNSAVNGKILYIDGVEVARDNTNTLSPSQMPTGTHFSIGRIHNQPYYFNGIIDEVRVWNVVRTEAQLATNMNTELSAQTGLVGLYHFNQGIAGGTNTGITTAIDASGNNNNGTLNNFALSGSSSNWVTGVVTPELAPTINNFSPSGGPIGTLVTITGTQLSNPTALNIGGVSAIPISNNGTTLVAMVMPGATTGTVGLTTANGTANGAGNFTVTASNPPNTQQGAKLVGTGEQGSSSSQGNPVAISADGNTAIVGTKYDNSGVGAVRIYIRSGNTWTQQGNKLVGTGANGSANQGTSVAISADGNTAIVGGYFDNTAVGAAWVFTRSGSSWTQQGNKLVGTGAVLSGGQGTSVSISADGNTAIVGAEYDNNVGAVWIYTRSGGVWTQQGNKLVGSGADGISRQGFSTSLSADGNTAIVGGYRDNNFAGAVWIYTRTGGVWTQQGSKLVGLGALGNSRQGISTALSADGNTAIFGGYTDNNNIGAVWIYTRTGGVWTQQGSKLVGSGAVGNATQGYSVSLSADGNTAMVGGNSDNNGAGATWIFARSGNTWNQKGPKLIGSGGNASSGQGYSVAISADGNTAIVGGSSSLSISGEAWVYNYVAPVPTISSFTPSNAKPGDVVTITGTNFNTIATNNVVFFGATQATVTAATATTLTVTIPSGATYAPITVLNNSLGLIARSNSNFNPIFSPNKSGIMTIESQVDFSTGVNSYPTSIAVGDIDGDGKADIAVTNYGTNKVAIFRNTSITGSFNSNSFAAQVDFATGSSPKSIAVGDLDGDGKPDLAIANSSSTSVSILRNTSTNGNIAFENKIDLLTGGSPYSVAIGDLDGDGKSDLAVANYANNNVSILRNNSTSGSIDFNTKVDFSTGSTPYSLVIGDLDGDSKSDLAVANYGADYVSVLRNTSTTGIINSSSFATKIDFNVGYYSLYSLAIGDLDGDGKTDLAVVGSAFNNVSVLRNTSTIGSLTFDAKVDLNFASSGSGAISLATGDLDGDGKADLIAVGNSNSKLYILRNISSSGTIGFTVKETFSTNTNTNSVIISDLDGDGKSDVAMVNTGSANSFSVFRNEDLTLDLPPTITSFSPLSAKPGDEITITGTNFNTTASNNVVFFGATQATVTSAIATSLTVTLPTGATYAPITVLNTGIKLATMSNARFNPIFSPAKTGLITMEPKVDIVTVDRPNSVTIGDIDGDGKPDLVVVIEGNNNRFISVYRNNSISGSLTGSSFAARVDIPIDYAPHEIAVGDLDGDGKLDLAVTTTNQVSVFRNTSSIGSISFDTRADVNKINIGSYSIAIGDLDGDGRADLVITDNYVSVLRNRSKIGSITSNSFAERVTFDGGSSPRSASIGDIDGDGKPDLVVVSYANNVSVLRNTSTKGNINASSFATKVTFDAGSAPQSVSIGDLDGDGKPDLAVANYGYNINNVSILRNNSTSGSIAFESKIDFAAGAAPYSIAIGDLDGDGKADLAVANFQTNYVSVLRNTSINGVITNSSFATKIDFVTSSDAYPSTIAVAIGDIDGDKRPDLIATINNTSKISIIRNISNNADLNNLAISSGTLSPTFATGTTAYTASVINAITSIMVTPTRSEGNANIQVQVNSSGYATIISGNASGSLALNVGTNTIDVKVTAQDGTTIKTYTITVTRGIPAPTITSFSPLNAKPGDTVTLTGTGFNTTAVNNIIFFGATQATVTAATATGIIVTVPVGATYAPITLLNTDSGLAAYSLQNFNPTYSPAKTNILAGDFASKQDFVAGDKPFGVAIGDLDGDGKPDLVVPNYNSNTVSVYRNISSTGSIGSGSFATKVDFLTGTNPRSVALGDLDGDGKPEIAVTNNGQSTVSIFHNTSNLGSISAGSFAGKQDFETGFSPISLAIGDLNGDGKPDLVVSNLNGASISVFRNTSSKGSIGSGSFATKQDYSTGDSPSSVVIGDLDGDGQPDLAVANGGLNTVSVLRNTSNAGSIGSINFETKQDFEIGTGPLSIAIADLDGDGKLDLATANFNVATVSVLRNTSSIGVSSFASKQDLAAGPGTYSLAIGDLDGDGKPDLVVANANSNSVSVFRNTSSTGISSFASKQDFTTGSLPVSVAVGDLDGDGKPELVVANYNQNSVSILQSVSNNADLSNLTISSGTLSQSFTSGTIAYTASVSNATNSITVTPTKADANASIQVRVNSGGYATVISGNTSAALALNVGSNTVDVKVTAQDGTTIKSYSITVTRTASSNADLSAMTISSGTLSPTFALGTLTYTAGVSNATNSITVTPTKADANASIQVQINGGGYATVVSGNASGSLALNTGSNLIDVKVTAQDGSTGKTYTITIEKGTLPVSLIDYQAKIYNNKSVLLSWSTISEQNNQGFEILKSTDGISFVKNGFVKGNGNSSSKNQYSFTDLFPVKGENYYKLVQVDLDGTKTELGIKAVKFSFDNGHEIQVYPNPSSNLVSIEFEASQYNTITVIDLAGKVIIKKDIPQTESKINLNIVDLPASTYIIKLQGKSGFKVKQLVKK